MTADSTPPLSSHIEQTINAIARLHAEHYGRSTWAERIVDRITAYLGRPIFLTMLCGFVVAWVAGNLFFLRIHHTAVDIPPFPWLQNILTLMALFMGILILTTQRRADQLADLREQMTLELSILTEHKAAKLIELIEELRRDSPEVRDRVDHEAREMAAHTDPHAVLGAIENSIKI